MIDVCAISDLHGYLIDIEKPFDVLLIAGDIVDLYYQRYSKQTKKWYKNEFLNWVKGLPFKDENSKVIIIAGNHEVGMEQGS